MNPVNRQDVQNIINIAQNRIMERMVTRQYLIVLSDAVKNITALHLQSQQMLKQSEYQRSQLTRRVVSLETRLATFENEVRSLNASVIRATGQRPQQVIMPVQTVDKDQEEALQQAAQYYQQPTA